LDVVAQQTTQAVKTVRTQAQFTNTLVQVTEGNVRRSAQVNMQAQVQVEANNGRVKLAEVNISVQASANITTNLSRIRSSTAQLTLQAQLVSTSVKTVRAQALVQSAAQIVAPLARIRRVQVQLQVLAQVQAPAVKTARTQLTLQAFNTQLASGQVLNYDPLMTIMVPREQRQAMILEETLLLRVKQESRVNMVRKIMQ
jgi:hypothetical protein